MELVSNSIIFSVTVYWMLERWSLWRKIGKLCRHGITARLVRCSKVSEYFRAAIDSASGVRN